MPSAANVKVEKSIAPTATGSDNGLIDNANVSPLRQAITVVEHKIRNLEKRKAKLESYRDLQKSGKDLNADQKTAIAKYDEVVQTLEFARDLSKQFVGIATATEKEEKKKARKDAVARSQAELNKVREILLIQDALTNMGQDRIRDDFLNARNGAAQLTSADLKLLDDYYGVVTPKHEVGDPTGFRPQVQAAAEHLLAVVDGKSKEVFGSTYSNIKDVIGKVHESGYLDQSLEPFEEQQQPIADADVVVVVAAAAASPPVVTVTAEVVVAEPAHDVSIEPIPPPPPPQPETVPQLQAAPEQPMFFSPPLPPQARPIVEMISTGSFFFLQESELDTPPDQITSQTFTNQSFASAPPPPIPMPPHFAQFPTVQPQAVAPPVVAQSMPLPVANKNGFETPNEASDEAMMRHRGAHRHQQQQQRATFFANNNGYTTNRSNRNSRNNNAPRLNSNNRHNNSSSN